MNIFPAVRVQNYTERVDYVALLIFSVLYSNLHPHVPSGSWCCNDVSGRAVSLSVERATTFCTAPVRRDYSMPRTNRRQRRCTVSMELASRRPPFPVLTLLPVNKKLSYFRDFICNVIFSYYFILLTTV